jgi:hypothetical protein
MGGSSQSSGGAVTVDGGSTVLRGCAFVDCESLASTADGFFEGGGAVALSRAVSLRLEGGTFTNCRAPNGAGGAIVVGFEDELAKEAMGQEWWRLVAAADGETMGLLQSRFDRCSAATQGGAVAVRVGTWTSSISMLVEDTAFTRSQLSSADDLDGGSLSMTFTAEVQDVTNIIRRSNFTDGVLMSDGGSIHGGGAYWGYMAAVTTMYTQIMQSIFSNTSIISEDSVYGTVYGAGLCMQMGADATNVRTVIEDSTIGGHTVQTAGGDIQGGSVFLYHNGPASSVAVTVKGSSIQSNLLTVVGGSGEVDGAGLLLAMFAVATNVRTVIEDSTIGGHTAQTAGGDIWGGSVLLYHGKAASSVAVTVKGSSMQSNSLTVAGGSGRVHSAGLCMEMFVEAINVTTSIEDSTIGGHTVQTAGGAIEGGSVFFYHGEAASSVAVVVKGSFMQSNLLTVVGGSGGSGEVNAGLYMAMFANAKNVSTVIENSTIGGHTVQTAGDIQGGSVRLYHAEAASSVAVVVKGSFMQSNLLTVAGGSGQVLGAGLSMTMIADATNVRTVIEDSTIGAHTAKTAGGVIEGGSVVLYDG